MKGLRQKSSFCKSLFVVMLLIFISGCSSKFERKQFVDATFNPNGNVKLDGRKVDSIDNIYTLTITGPLKIDEIGTIHIPTLMYGDLNYEAAKIVNPNGADFYIPLTQLTQTGNIEYRNRTLGLKEWIQLNPYLTFFIFLSLIVIFIIWVNHKANIRRQIEYEAEQRRRNKMREEQEKEEYHQKLNSLLSKSGEIVNKILPYYEIIVKESIESAKYEFTENVFSPFWSEIEKASKYFACYKEALTQLCFNSELYNNIILENKKYNFSLPFPFPFATNISIPKTVLDDYNHTIRKAQKVPTFSIIWEQRRNSEILIAGFRTLESAIADMSNQITWAINDLNNSISSGLDSIKYIQKEQLKTFESSTNYLQSTLNSMDNKLYYIQWKQKPPGTFFHR
jgi:hypothetical protein